MKTDTADHSSSNLEAHDSSVSWPVQSAQSAVRLFSSEQLFGTNSELQIQHRGECYHLRITRNGGLILTK